MEIRENFNKINLKKCIFESEILSESISPLVEKKTFWHQIEVALLLSFIELSWISESHRQRKIVNENYFFPSFRYF